MYCPQGRLSTFLLSLILLCNVTTAQETDAFAPLQKQFEQTQQAALKQYCLSCHSAAEKQGELDLEQFQ